MPLPKPISSESQDDFIARCVGNEMMLEEYPEQDQRAAVCHAQWANRQKENPAMSYKSRLPFEIKEISEQGTFEGLLSPYGNVDEGGDVVERGAYTKTLQDKGDTRPLLWEHREPIGELALEDRPDGLWVKGNLLMDLPEAKKAYLLIKARIAKGLSVGFKAIKAPIENGIRHLKEIKLFEGSIVLFPMNELAEIISIKAAQKKLEGKADFNTELALLQIFRGFSQMLDALGTALWSVHWADLNREEKLAAWETIIQQFAEAWAAFAPLYLDAMEETHGPMQTWSREAIETKAGAMISAGNRDKISAAMGKIMAGHNDLLALLEKEAGDDKSTSTSKAAQIPDPPQGAPGEYKSEPEQDNHSAAERQKAQTLISDIRALIPA